MVALRHDWAHDERDPQTWGTWTGAAVNGLRLTGELGTPDGTRCTDFPSLNGLKVVPLQPQPAGAAAVQVDYTMSAGFPGFEAHWV